MKYLKKHRFPLVIILGLLFWSCTNVEKEDGLNPLIVELYGLGTQQNPDEIDNIPTFEEDSIVNVVVEGCSESDDGVDYCRRAMGRNYWFQDNIIFICDALSIASPIILSLLGIYLKRRGKRFVGTMLKSSYLGMCLECICLLILFGAYSLENTSLAGEFASFVVGFFLLLSFAYGPFLGLACGLYIYGWAITIYIYKSSGSRFRSFGLIATLLCGSIIPFLFVIPIVYFISKRYPRSEDGKQTFLFRLFPHFCGSLIGWFAPFLIFLLSFLIR